jgi:transcriptional regulator with XRE-family HTH domain
MRARELVAWNLRRLRVRRGLSQEALAHDAALDRSYASGLERGTTNPTVDLLDRIATALGVPVKELFRVPRASEKPARPLKGGRKARA